MPQNNANVRIGLKVSSCSGGHF